MLRRSILIIIFFLCGSPLLRAQNVNGVVKDALSRFPIANTQIITSKATVLTNSNGEFSLAHGKVGDRIAIRIMGYETTEMVIHNLTDTLKVYLKQDAIALKEVLIKTHRNYKLDSLNLRKEYAGAFTYKGPSFSDMFIQWDPGYNSPFGFSNPKSTASLVSLNVLQVINLFGKKKTEKTRLKETLLRDEELKYVDNIFSKEKVKSITGLEEEALVKFIDIYRPSALNLKKMTGYELTLYIKKCYEEFKKEKL